MRLWKENLLFQFSVTSFVVVALIGILLSTILTSSVREYALIDAVKDTQETLSLRVIRQLAPEDMSQPMTGDRLLSLNRFMTERIISERIARIKIWNRKGQVIYSDDFSQIGKAYPPNHELTEALNGNVALDLSGLEKAESESERHMGALLEVYIPIVFPGSQEVKGAFEIYQYYAPIASFIASQHRVILATTSVGFVFLYLALFLIVARGWRTIRAEHQHTEKAFKEIKALNNLFLNHIQQRQYVIDAIQKLSRRAEQIPRSDEELRQLCEELKHIAEEASLYPDLPSVSGNS